MQRYVPKIANKKSGFIPKAFRIAACSCAVLMAASPSFASDALQSFLAEMIAKEDVADVVYKDLDADGIDEAIVYMLNEDSPGAGRAWRVVSDKDDTPKVIFNWVSKQSHVMDTPPRGAVIWADGATWALGPRGVYAYYDLVVQNISGIISGGAAEIEMIKAQGFAEPLPEMVDMLRIDMFDTPGREKIITLNDDQYRLENYAQPYFITDAENNVIETGFSIFHPAIYRNPEGGIIVIEDHGSELFEKRVAAPTSK